jgi:hypothetical protein
VNSEKYIGQDVHQATIVVAVMDSTGKLVMESILETKAATILQFFCGIARNLGGDLRRRNLVRLVVRFAPLPRRQTGGVQSAEERAAQRREQERPHASIASLRRNSQAEP